jgi:hypothetical protein
LSKVLTDVDVLARECVPRWLRSPGMSTAKIAEFYAHPRKRRTDALSLSRARSERHMGVSRGLLWRAARMRRSLWITRGSGLGIRRQVQG